MHLYKCTCIYTSAHAPIQVHVHFYRCTCTYTSAHAPITANVLHHRVCPCYNECATRNQSNTIEHPTKRTPQTIINWERIRRVSHYNRIYTWDCYTVGTTSSEDIRRQLHQDSFTVIQLPSPGTPKNRVVLLNRQWVNKNKFECFLKALFCRAT